MKLALSDRSSSHDLILLNIDFAGQFQHSFGSKVIGWQEISTVDPFPSPKLHRHQGIRHTYIWNALNRVAYKGSELVICEWIRGVSLEEMLKALIDLEDPAQTWLVGGDWYLASRIRAKFLPVREDSRVLQVV